MAPDDRLLLARIATGDEDALHDLYQRYAPRFTRYPLFSPTQGFAIGERMVYGQGIGVPQSTLLAFDNGKWSVIPSGD